MEIIPVVDLKGGVVVRARMGQREGYRPIETPLSPTSDAVDVTRGLLSIHPFATLYVADLDAIEGRGDNRVALTRLRAEFPQLALWVDNGISDRRSAEDRNLLGLARLTVDAALAREHSVGAHFRTDDPAARAAAEPAPTATTDLEEAA